MRSIQLNDEEIMALDGKVNADAQKMVDKVKGIHEFADIGHIVFAEVVWNAVQNHELDSYFDLIERCDVCGKHASYPMYKSGAKKGKPNYTKDRIRFHGIVFRYGFHKICADCYDFDVREYIIKHDLPVEVTGGRWAKEVEKKCFGCGELMWEFDMFTRMTLMGGGKYHAGCPHCSAESLPFGRSHELTGKSRAVTTENLYKDMNCWRRKVQTGGN